MRKKKEIGEWHTSNLKRKKETKRKQYNNNKKENVIKAKIFIINKRFLPYFVKVEELLDL